MICGSDKAHENPENIDRMKREQKPRKCYLLGGNKIFSCVLTILHE